MEEKRAMGFTLLGAILVLIGALSGLFGMAIFAIVGIGLGAYVIYRSAFAPGAEPRERRGPGQSGPGDPGYRGQVNLGDDDQRRAG